MENTRKRNKPKTNFQCNNASELDKILASSIHHALNYFRITKIILFFPKLFYVSLTKLLTSLNNYFF